MIKAPATKICRSVKRFSTGPIANWVAAVVAIIAPVVAPTPAPEPPPAAAHKGTTDISGAKLHSAVAVASITSTKSRLARPCRTGSLIVHPRGSPHSQQAARLHRARAPPSRHAHLPHPSWRLAQESQTGPGPAPRLGTVVGEHTV